MKIFSAVFFLLFSLTFGETFAETPKPQIHTPKFLIISCSLSTNSVSRLLAKQAVTTIKSQGEDAEFIDLLDYNLPLSNGHEGTAYDHPKVKEIHDRIDKADGILIASPIYNNSVAAVTKNLMELTTHPHKTILSGKAWSNKAVGFMGASGGKASTYAFFPFINSLTLEGQIVFVPSFVMATRDDFNDKKECSEETRKRIEDTINDLIRITKALKEK